MCIEKTGCRWVIAVMIFTSTIINYMMRVNISVNIVAMVPVSNGSVTTNGDTLDWEPFQRANILSGYFWGYLASNSFSGLVAERYGARLVALVMVLTCAVLTLVSPAAAKHSYVMMLIIRVAVGFCSGFLYPSMLTLIAKWAVPTERGKFMGALIGGAIGTFITWTLGGVIIDAFGWEWGFYTFGIFSLLWCIPWWFLVYDTPDRHPRISISEVEYINKEMSVSKKTKRFPPYRRILTSLPIWSLLIANFGTGWGIYFVLTAAPSYLNYALGYNISSTGALSGTIYLFRSVASLAFGSAGDFILKRKILSLLALRRLAIIGSHIIPGCIVLCLAIPGFSPIVYVVLMNTALTLNALVTLSSAANTYDLTSNFVGAVGSLTLTLMSSAGIISPFVTAHFTKYNETNPDAWRPVFYTGSAVYIFSGVQFIIFGSTKMQNWDIIETKNEKDQPEIIENVHK